MLNKKQEDNRLIQEIKEYHEHEAKRRERDSMLGCFRIGEHGVLELCNGIINGEPRWAIVNDQLP